MYCCRLTVISEKKIIQLKMTVSECCVHTKKITLNVLTNAVRTEVFFHKNSDFHKLFLFNTRVVSIHVPVVQFNPIHPASHEHIPSVCRHVLQFREQTYEQCLP